MNCFAASYTYVILPSKAGYQVIVIVTHRSKLSHTAHQSSVRAKLPSTFSKDTLLQTVSFSFFLTFF